MFGKISMIGILVCLLGSLVQAMYQTMMEFI